MPPMELRLERFEFPRKLPNNKANFRVLFDIHYETRNDIKHAASIKPGADTFWECDIGRSQKANFVRAKDARGKWTNQINVPQLDDWDRTVIYLKGDSVRAVRAKVFDVNRGGFWDKIGAIAGSLLTGFARIAKKKVTAAVPEPLDDATGDASEEISSYIIKKVVGGDDTVLFQGSARPDQDGMIAIEGMGSDGNGGKDTYRIELAVIT